MKPYVDLPEVKDPRCEFKSECIVYMHLNLHNKIKVTSLKDRAGNSRRKKNQE